MFQTPFDEVSSFILNENNWINIFLLMKFNVYNFSTFNISEFKWLVLKEKCYKLFAFIYVFFKMITTETHLIQKKQMKSNDKEFYWENEWNKTDF